MNEVVKRELELRDADKRGQLGNLNYLELLTLAIPIIQKHEQEINDLKQQVKQLQAKLDNI